MTPLLFFSLVPEFQRSDLYEEFLQERKNYKFYNRFLWIFGYGCLLTYLILLWGFGVRDPIFFLLDVIGLVSRLSGIVLHKMYEVPKIFGYLFSERLALQTWSYNTIDKYRVPIMGCLLKNLFGNDTQVGMERMNFQELKNFLIDKNFMEWRKGGKIYFQFYIIFVLGMFATIFLNLPD